MTDRELLELAAKAAGIEWQSYHMSRGLCLANPRGGMVITQMWNPLTDDGDALRLAVNLELIVDSHGMQARAGLPYDSGTVYEVIGEDRNASVRRAIVRAAAEIGKAMP